MKKWKGKKLYSYPTGGKVDKPKPKSIMDMTEEEYAAYMAKPRPATPAAVKQYAKPISRSDYGGLPYKPGTPRAGTGQAEYIPVESMLLPASLPIRGGKSLLGRAGVEVLNAVNPLQGMRNLKSAAPNLNPEAYSQISANWHPTLYNIGSAAFGSVTPVVYEAMTGNGDADPEELLKNMGIGAGLGYLAGNFTRSRMLPREYKKYAAYYDSYIPNKDYQRNLKAVTAAANKARTTLANAPVEDYIGDLKLQRNLKRIEEGNIQDRMRDYYKPVIVPKTVKDWEQDALINGQAVRGASDYVSRYERTSLNPKKDAAISDYWRNWHKERGLKAGPIPEFFSTIPNKDADEYFSKVADIGFEWKSLVKDPDLLYPTIMRQNKNGGAVKKFEEGGIVPEGHAAINIEKGELLVHNGKEIRGYPMQDPHAKKGKESLKNIVHAPVGTTIIPKRLARAYREGDALRRKSIEANLIVNAPEPEAISMNDVQVPQAKFGLGKVFKTVKDVGQNTLALTADNTLSIVGASNVVDNNGWYTDSKFGKTTQDISKVTNKVSQVAGVAAATALGGPAAGMAMSTLQQGVGSIDTPSQSTINNTNPYTEQAGNTLAQMGSSATSLMSPNQQMMTAKNGGKVKSLSMLERYKQIREANMFVPRAGGGKGIVGFDTTGNMYGTAYDPMDYGVVPMNPIQPQQAQVPNNLSMLPAKTNPRYSGTQPIPAPGPDTKVVPAMSNFERYGVPGLSALSTALPAFEGLRQAKRMDTTMDYGSIPYQDLDATAGRRSLAKLYNASRYDLNKMAGGSSGAALAGLGYAADAQALNTAKFEEDIANRNAMLRSDVDWKNANLRMQGKQDTFAAQTLRDDKKLAALVQLGQAIPSAAADISQARQNDQMMALYASTYGPDNMSNMYWDNYYKNRRLPLRKRK